MHWCRLELYSSALLSDWLLLRFTVRECFLWSMRLNYGVTSLSEWRPVQGSKCVNGSLTQEKHYLRAFFQRSSRINVMFGTWLVISPRMSSTVSFETFIWCFTVLAKSWFFSKREFCGDLARDIFASDLLFDSWRETVSVSFWSLEWICKMDGFPQSIGAKWLLSRWRSCSVCDRLRRMFPLEIKEPESEGMQYSAFKDASAAVENGRCCEFKGMVEGAWGELVEGAAFFSEGKWMGAAAVLFEIRLIMEPSCYSMLVSSELAVSIICYSSPWIALKRADFEIWKVKSLQRLSGGKCVFRNSYKEAKN